MKGFDCATPLTASRLAALAAAGMKFAARYLVPASYAWKRLTAAEAQVISDAGLQIVSVFELTSNRASQGASAGREDGIAALAEARLIGQPKGSAIYFAVDYDAPPADYDAIERYLEAARGQMTGYAAGVYGSYSVIEEMAKRGACDHFWQTYSWSRGKKSGHSNIYQYRNGVSIAGVPLDLDESYGSEGWWNLRKEVKPKMTQEDADKIIRFLSAAWFAATTPQDKAEFHRLANEVRKAAGLPEE